MSTDIELIKEYQLTNDIALRDIAILNNTGLVCKALRKYNLIGHRNYEDLYQEGLIGVIEAVEKFDTSKDYQFSTYAMFFIKKYILKYVSQNHHNFNLYAKTIGIRKVANNLPDLDLSSYKDCLRFCKEHDVTMGDVLNYDRTILKYSLQDAPDEYNISLDKNSCPLEQSIKVEILERIIDTLTTEEQSLVGYRHMPVEDKAQYAKQKGMGTIHVNYYCGRAFKKIKHLCA